MTNIVSQMSVHQQHELLDKLEAAGLTGPLAQRVIESRGNILAKEVVTLIRGSQPAFPSYSVTVDYSQTVEQLVRAGHYDWSNGNITSGHFLLAKKEDKKNMEIFLVETNSWESNKEVDQMLIRLGLRDADIREELALGAQFPDLQRQGPIVARGSTWRDPYGNLYVPCLDGDGSDRYLGLDWFGGDWFPSWRFAAVRK